MEGGKFRDVTVVQSSLGGWKVTDRPVASLTSLTKVVDHNFSAPFL